jgi:hypothetical protein
MDWARSVGAGIFALLIAVVYLIIFVPLIQTTLAAETKPNLGPFAFALATLVAGYVGGVIAMWYGVEPPNGVRVLGARLLPPASDIVKVMIGLGYLLIYVGVTAFAAYAWWQKGDVTPEVLTAEVTVAVGLAFAIATKFISRP